MMGNESLEFKLQLAGGTLKRELQKAGYVGSNDWRKGMVIE
jgi:hypothetical protein